MFGDIDPNEMAKAALNVRKNPSTIEKIAIQNEDKNKKFFEANKLPEAIHWKDTLISKGKDQFTKEKYDYKRIVAIGDVHGDFKKLESILRQAELIDEKNDWIGTDSILVQVVNIKKKYYVYNINYFFFFLRKINISYNIYFILLFNMILIFFSQIH